jgi:hypothetical protein
MDHSDRYIIVFLPLLLIMIGIWSVFTTAGWRGGRQMQHCHCCCNFPISNAKQPSAMQYMAGNARLLDLSGGRAMVTAQLPMVGSVRQFHSVLLRHTTYEKWRAGGPRQTVGVSKGTLISLLYSGEI